MRMKNSNLELVKYMRYLAQLSDSFQSFSFNYLSRSENQFADALAILASVLKISEESNCDRLELKRESNMSIVTM